MASSSLPRKLPQLEVPVTSPFERPKLTSNPTRTTSHRLPPPALFQGPPSKNASHISLVLPTDRVPGAPSTETDSGGQQHRIIRPSQVPPASSFSGPSSGHLRNNAANANAAADDHRAEQLWAEMQKTLADVEVSAMNTSHVFGEDHLRALEELRTAQLSLAQTWAKTEADELLEHDFDNASRNEANVGAALEAQTSALSPTPSSARPKGSTPVTGSSPATAGVKDNSAKDKDNSNNNSNSNKPSAFTNNKDLEEETERDIQLARKRREANDRYFSQVNRGVVEVVSKLDEVAGAMRRVERESREIWDESSDEDDDDEADGTGASEAEDGDADGEGGSATDRTGLTDSPVPVRKDG